MILTTSTCCSLAMGMCAWMNASRRSSLISSHFVMVAVAVVGRVMVSRGEDDGVGCALGWFWVRRMLGGGFKREDWRARSKEERRKTQAGLSHVPSPETRRPALARATRRRPNRDGDAGPSDGTSRVTTHGIKAQTMVWWPLALTSIDGVCLKTPGGSETSRYGLFCTCG